MPRKLLGHMRQNVVAYLALFIALGGTSAYAANTIRSGDIIDNEVTTTDVRDDTLGFGGLFAQDLAAGSVENSEVANNSLGNGDFLTGSVDTRVVTNDSLTGTDIQNGSIGSADLSGTVGATPFIGRGHLTCNPNCFAFNFRPQGFTNNAEPGALEDRPFRSPPGGLRVSDFVATLSTTVPGGQAFNIWLIQFSTSNAYLTCSIPGGTSNCSATPAAATIPAGDLFWVVINTSYSVSGNPYLDFSFRAQPAS